MPALTELCSSSQTFLGAIAMILIIMGVIALFFSFFVKKPIVRVIGIALLLVAVLTMTVYVLIPPLFSASGVKIIDCSRQIVPPYCGSVCYNSSFNESGKNCTCIMY